MAQYSKKDILGFIAMQIDAIVSTDVGKMAKDFEKLGYSMSQKNIESYQKRREDAFSILLILLDLADNNIEDDGFSLDGDVQEAMALFNSQRKLS